MLWKHVWSVAVVVFWNPSNDRGCILFNMIPSMFIWVVDCAFYMFLQVDDICMVTYQFIIWGCVPWMEYFWWYKKKGSSSCRKMNCDIFKMIKIHKNWVLMIVQLLQHRVYRPHHIASYIPNCNHLFLLWDKKISEHLSFSHHVTPCPELIEINSN